VSYNQPTGSGLGIFGLTASNVSANRYEAGTVHDRVAVKVSNWSFQFLTFGHSGQRGGNPITMAEMS
jgi:hypothetical protein